MHNTHIETPRLQLRPPAVGDFPGWCSFCADEETMQHLGGVKHEADAWRSLASVIGVWQLRGFGMFSLIEKSSGAWVGRVGPWEPHLWPVQEVGWGLLSAYAGRGYALEAAVASIDYAFARLDWPAVSHLIADDNADSRKLAGRLGSTPGEEAKMPGSLAKEQVRVWSQTREDWLARRSSFDALVPRE